LGNTAAVDFGMEDPPGTGAAWKKLLADPLGAGPEYGVADNGETVECGCGAGAISGKTAGSGLE